MIIGQVVNVLIVSSSTKEDASYGTKITVGENQMFSCTYRDYKKSNASCKRMYLLCKVESFGSPIGS